MSTINICDRCAAATTNPALVMIGFGERIDLCEGCLADLRRWLNEKS